MSFLNNAPMKSWLEFFSDIKKLKIPQQSHIYQVGEDDNDPGSGDYDEHHPLERLTNENSKLLPSLVAEAV